MSERYQKQQKKTIVNTTLGRHGTTKLHQEYYKVPIGPEGRKVLTKMFNFAWNK